MHDRLVGLRDALCNFIDARETQSQSHIRLLHWHIVERLVIEGGFHPDSVVPHPPLRVETIRSGTRQGHRLIYVYAAPALRKTTERLFWAPDSPAFGVDGAAEFEPRVGEA